MDVSVASSWQFDKNFAPEQSKMDYLTLFKRLSCKWKDTQNDNSHNPQLIKLRQIFTLPNIETQEALLINQL